MSRLMWTTIHVAGMTGIHHHAQLFTDWDGGLRNFFLGWPWTTILLIPTSQVAGVTVPSHINIFLKNAGPIPLFKVEYSLFWICWVFSHSRIQIMHSWGGVFMKDTVSFLGTQDDHLPPHCWSCFVLAKMLLRFCTVSLIFSPLQLMSSLWECFLRPLKYFALHEQNVSFKFGINWSFSLETIYISHLMIRRALPE
jgi:hypothetical protein